MKVENMSVYEVEESMVASGLPMKLEYNHEEFERHVYELACSRSQGRDISKNQDYLRAVMLANAPHGSGVNNFLSGILVSMSVTATVKWWQQMERYHFVQIVSSMSTMHRLKDMVTSGLIHFNECVPEFIAQDFTNYAKKFYDSNELAYSCPMGIEETARITTNYLSLRTIYAQRLHHKLQEWHEFCCSLEKLPYAKEFIIVNKESK